MSACGDSTDDHEDASFADAPTFDADHDGGPLARVDATADADSSQENPTGYLLAFHTCDPSLECGNPSNHRVQLAQSADGESWSIVDGWTETPGSVPDVIRRNDEALVYMAGGWLLRYDFLSATVGAPERVEIDGLAGTFVDPSLAFDDDGKLVMFFLDPEDMMGDPARCPDGVDSCTKYFRSATEIDGSDGTRFELDDGDRLALEIESGASASDPDIFRGDDEWVLYVSRGASVQPFVSSDLRGSFTPVDDLPMGYLGQIAVASGLFTDDEYWTIGHISTMDGVAIIRRAVHETITTPIASDAWEDLIGPDTIGLGSLKYESPGIALNAR